MKRGKYCSTGIESGVNTVTTIKFY
jgi:hypothetical protein